MSGRRGKVGRVGRLIVRDDKAVDRIEISDTDADCDVSVGVADIEKYAGVVSARVVRVIRRQAS